MGNIIKRVYSKTVNVAKETLNDYGINKREIFSLLELYEYMMADKNIASIYLEYLFLEDLEIDEMLYEYYLWNGMTPEAGTDAYYTLLIKPLLSIIRQLRYYSEKNFTIEDFWNINPNFREFVFVYGASATDFLVQVLNVPIISKVGNDYVITTSSDYPEKVFIEYIRKGYKLDIIPRLIYNSDFYEKDLSVQNCSLFIEKYPITSYGEGNLMSDEHFFPRCETNENNQVEDNMALIRKIINC